MVPTEDPVAAALGDFGPWQARSLLLISLVKIPTGWHMLSILFLAPNPEAFGGRFVCARDSNNNISLTEWIQTRHPADKKYLFGFNPCYVYHGVNASDASSTSSLEECDKFEFFVKEPTMVTQWSLVCDRIMLVSVIQFAYLVGVTSGGVLAFISLKRRFSPKIIIMVGTALQVSAGIVGGVQHVYEVHCFLKFLIGFGTCLMFTAAQQIIVDISFGWRKTVFSVCFEYFWSIGVITLGWLDAAADSWSTLQLIISVPSSLFILMWRIVPESPRWLIAHEQYDNADRLLKFAAACNGRVLPEDFTTKKSIPSPVSTGERLPKLKLVCLQIMWIATISYYYGGLLNIKNVGGPTLPVRTTMAGSAEIIGATIGLLFILKPRYKFGLMSGLLLIGGTSCASSFAIPPDESGSTSGWTMVVLAFVGRIAIACSFAIMTNGSLELLPADRRALIGVIMITVARLVLMATPFLNTLAFYGESITLTLYGCLALTTACCAFCLFVSAEWSKLCELCRKKEYTPQVDTNGIGKAEIVVCTHFNRCFIDDNGIEIHNVNA